jgi:hypothetical protein
MQDQDLWRRFAEATTSQAFCESWLSLQCHMFRGVRSALLLLGAPDTGPFTPAAVFPHASYSVKHLTGVAESALKERRGLLIKNEPVESSEGALPGGYQVAYPIEVSGKLHGVVIFEMAELPSQDVQSVMRQLHWGVAWLEVLLPGDN